MSRLRCPVRVPRGTSTRRPADPLAEVGAFRLGERTVHLRRPSIIEIREKVGLLNTLPISFDADTCAGMLIDGALSTNNFAGLTEWLRPWIGEADLCEEWLLEANAGQLTVLIENAILPLIELAWFRRHLSVIREEYRRSMETPEV